MIVDALACCCQAARCWTLVIVMTRRRYSDGLGDGGQYPVADEPQDRGRLALCGGPKARPDLRDLKVGVTGS